MPQSAAEKISNLFAQDSLIVPKKTKNGVQDQDIIPMIRSLDVHQADINTLVLNALVCCQNPTLNPMQLPLAIEMHLPEVKPDFSRSARVELYTTQETIFR